MRLAPGPLAEAVAARLERWDAEGFTERLWRHEPTLWGQASEREIADRLGWLTLPESSSGALPEIRRLAETLRGEEVDEVVVLGMGGSSLAPDVFQRTLGPRPGYPRLSVLDSTHPGSVSALADRLRPGRAFFLVSSKSGTTLETLDSFRWAWRWCGGAEASAGRHFAAVTDPGSLLEELARARGFRAVFRADSDVGGRYSALTHFGLVPAGCLGLDLERLLATARPVMQGAAAGRRASESPAIRLGALLAEGVLAGRDKVTFLTSPGLASLPDWIEQLLAESTGKDGTGIVPVAGEPPRMPEGYGNDRLFVGMTLLRESSRGLGETLGALERLGHPVVRIELASAYELGAEMYRWELATAAAGAALGIHPFDQPDVQLAKTLTREAMAGGAAGGEQAPVVAVETAAARGALDAFLRSVGAGDYLAVQAYLAVGGSTLEERLGPLRRGLGERTGAATTLGFGPRFLHSTGQLHKGGANNGCFLQLIDSPRLDVEVPETSYTFGRLVRAQAEGDARALLQRGRRLLRLDLGADAAQGVAVLGAMI